MVLHLVLFAFYGVKNCLRRFNELLYLASSKSIAPVPIADNSSLLL